MTNRIHWSFNSLHRSVNKFRFVRGTLESTVSTKRSTAQLTLEAITKLMSAPRNLHIKQSNHVSCLNNWGSEKKQLFLQLNMQTLTEAVLSLWIYLSDCHWRSVAVWPSTRLNTVLQLQRYRGWFRPNLDWCLVTQTETPGIQRLESVFALREKLVPFRLNAAI